jgi:hypothetical protein
MYDTLFNIVILLCTSVYNFAGAQLAQVALRVSTTCVGLTKAVAVLMIVFLT